jgi:hypothetical protein
MRNCAKSFRKNWENKKVYKEQKRESLRIEIVLICSVIKVYKVY